MARRCDKGGGFFAEPVNDKPRFRPGAAHYPTHDDNALLELQPVSAL